VPHRIIFFGLDVTFLSLSRTSSTERQERRNLTATMAMA